MEILKSALFASHGKRIVSQPTAPCNRLASGLDLLGRGIRVQPQP